jgi:hypothetical protein
MAVPVEILGKHVASVQNITENAESHATNYSPNLTSDSESESFAPQALDRRRPQSVQIPNMEVRMLRRMEEDPGTSVQKIAAAVRYLCVTCLENSP